MKCMIQFHAKAFKGRPGENHTKHLKCTVQVHPDLGSVHVVDVGSVADVSEIQTVIS
jgi:hypothetical protein